MTERLTILQLTWRLSQDGGVPIVVRNLLQHIDQSRFGVHVCSIRPLHAEDGIGHLAGLATLHSLQLAGAATPIARMRAQARFQQVVRTVQPDVLHVHSGTASYAVPAALMSRQRMRVIEVHDAPQSGRLSGTTLALERFMHRRLGFRPLVHSSAVRDDLAHAWRADQDSITVVPLGVDLLSYTRPALARYEVRSRLGIPATPPLVLYVARVVPEKRPELFIQVAARVHAIRPDVVFALVGSGPGLDQVRREVQALGLDGVFAAPGFVDDLPSTYHAADIFLSTSRYEGFGLAVAEALACGLPVVSTDVGGVRDVIDDSGILVDRDDPDLLARKVLALLDDPERRSRLSKSARARADTALDSRQTAREFEAFYEEALRHEQ